MCILKAPLNHTDRYPPDDRQISREHEASLPPLLLPVLSPQDGSDVFLLVASASWQHLTPQTRKALRASCLSGRQLHDSLWEHLRLDFGVPNRFSCPSREKSGKAPRSAPTPSELRSCVSGVLQRGARLRSMTLSFQLSPRDKPLPLQEREQQL